jgi:hypothetical protein
VPLESCGGTRHQSAALFGHFNEPDRSRVREAADSGLKPGAAGQVQDEDTETPDVSGKYSRYIRMRKFGGAGI